MRRPRLGHVLACAGLAAAACGGASKPPAAAEAPAHSQQQAPADEDRGEGDRDGPAAAEPEGARRFENVGFSTPESVQHDPQADVWIVSNIEGSPLDADGKGFLSRIDPKTGKVEARWIDSGKHGVTLNAPKGIAISGDRIAVTDIDRVRFFDRTTGAPKGEVRLEGATFANDVSFGPGGVLYVSDMGMGDTPKGFGPTGTDALWRILPDGTAEKVASGKDLGHPNGVAAGRDGVWVVTFGSAEIYQIADGARRHVTKPGAGRLDGLVLLPDGSALFSSWERKAIYRGPLPEGPFAPILTDLNAPADIGYDASRRLVLVPLFEDDAVLALPLPPKTP
ncbi:MAG: hypothetical protein D6705_12420 [Deltaproteobacteria bacterium]|nr:MAG: hypothetical protein D6705_12420 [Deltaproteobacteria bacterium]